MRRRPTGGLLASGIITALLSSSAYSEPLTGATSLIPAQVFGAAGSTGTRSANFISLGTAGDVQGPGVAGASGVRAGHAYTVFSQVVAPAAASVTAVSSKTVSIAWDTAGNPSSTTYSVQLASGPFSGYQALASSEVIGGAHTFSSLTPMNPYVARVRAHDKAFSPTEYAATAATQTAPADLPAGCAAGFNVRKDGGGDYTTISAALNALPSSLPGETCVVVRDTQTYSEQVAVQGFTNNGYRLRLMADPGLADSPPSISPPAGSTAAFVIANASATVQGFSILPASAITYGIQASSAYVTISSVSVLDPSGLIGDSGVAVSSYSAVEYSSVTTGIGAQYAYARAIVISGAGSVVKKSTAVNNGPNAIPALLVNGGRDNLLQDIYVRSLRGAGAYLANTQGNVFSGGYIESACSQCAGQTNCTCAPALDVVDSSSNSFSGMFLNGGDYGAKAAYIRATSGVANHISGSTLTANCGGGTVTLASQYSTISHCYVSNVGLGMAMDFMGHDMVVTQSTLTSRTTAGIWGTILWQGARNTVSGSWISNSAGNGIGFYNAQLRASVISSTITSSAAGYAAVHLNGSGQIEGVTISSSYLQGETALLIQSATATTVTDSVLYSSYNGFGVVVSSNGRNSTIARSMISGDAGGVMFQGFNGTISQSTITSQGQSKGIHVTGSSLTISNCYVQGSTAVYIYQPGWAGLSILSSVLVSTHAQGMALDYWAPSGGNLILSSNTLSGGPAAAAVQLYDGGPGTATLASNVIQAGRIGLYLDISSGVSLSIASMTFSGPLLAGATAISFGGTWPSVSTFSRVDFADTNMAVNVDAGRLPAGSRITMRDSTGLKGGSGFETDPNGVVDWQPDFNTLPERPSVPAGVALGISSISWTWAAAGGAATYRVFHASSPATLLATTVSPSFQQVGLATNSAHGIVVAGLNGIGVGPLSNAATAYTAAEIPSSLAVNSVSSTTAALAWSGGTNPAGTVYELQRSTGGLWTTMSSGTQASGAASGLSASTAYSFRVRAFNGDLVPTGFSATAATTTWPPPPGLPGIPAGTALGISSISWTWPAATDGAAYLVHPATNSGVQIGSATAAIFAQTGLPANTSSSILVTGVNASGAGPQSSSGTAVFTLANPPAGMAVAAVYSGSATLTWMLNGNPAATTAEVDRSTDGAAYSTVFRGSATAHTEYGLSGCTTYYMRVRNRNGNWLASAYDGAVLFTTRGSTPAAPGGLQAEPLAGNRVALSWTPSFSEDATSYRLYYDAGTAAIDYNTPLAVFTSTETSYTTAVLVSSAAYRFGLRARNRCGVEERNTTALAMAPSLASLTGVRAAIKVPQTGKRIKGNRVTVVAELALGDAWQTRQVRFQHKASSAPSWADIAAVTPNNPNPDLSAPYFVHWDVTGLTPASYDLRAVAADFQDNMDPAPAAITVTVTNHLTEWDISESVDLGTGKPKKEQMISNTVANTVQAADEGSGGQVTKVQIPAGALDASTVAVSVINSPPVVPPTPAGVQAAGVVTQIEIPNQTQLAGGKTATVTLAYPDANGDGLVDGTTARVDRLEMYSAATVAGPWLKDVATSVDNTNKTVSGITSHFSFFALFAAAAANLDTMRVYPNPFRPNNGNTDDGVPYAPGNVNSGIVFDNLPASVSIKIYALNGGQVASFSSDNSGGRLQWDVRNNSGRNVASGVYFAVIQSPGNKIVVKKLLIVR